MAETAVNKKLHITTHVCIYICIYKNRHVYCVQISILYIYIYIHFFNLDIYINIWIYIRRFLALLPFQQFSTLAKSSWKLHLTVGRSSQSSSFTHDRLAKMFFSFCCFFLMLVFLMFVSYVCMLILVLILILILNPYSYSYSYSCCSWCCCWYLAVHDIITWSWCWPLLSSCCEWSKLTSVAKVDHFAMTKQRMNQIAYKWLGENPSQSHSLWIKSFRSALKTVDTALARTFLIPKTKSYWADFARNPAKCKGESIVPG